jgi:hypothetical protein
MTENNAFDFFDFSEEEATEKAREFEYEKYDRDKRICICGHPMKRHTELDEGKSSCSPSRLICKCRYSRPVLETSDTRVFLRKTRGTGSGHALSQGILAAKGKHEITWLIDMKCDRCQDEAKVSPVVVTRRGVIISHFDSNDDRDEEKEIFHKLLCQNCREESF